MGPLIIWMIILLIIFILPRTGIVIKEPTISGVGIIVVIIFIIGLIGVIIEYIKETLIPSITQATSSTMQATTRGLGDLYSLSIGLSTNHYFSAMLISLICLILCLNISRTKADLHTKIEIDSSNTRLKKLLRDL